MENNNNNFFNFKQELIKKINNDANSKKEELLNEVESLKNETRAMQGDVLRIKLYRYEKIIKRKEASLKILKDSKNILGIDLNSQSSEQLKEKLNKILNAKLNADSILKPESIKQLQKDLENLLGIELSFDEILQLKENFNTILEITINSQYIDHLKNAYLDANEIASNLIEKQKYLNNLCVKDNIIDEDALSRAKKCIKAVTSANEGNLDKLNELCSEIDERVKNIENLVIKIKPIKKFKK